MYGWALNPQGQPVPIRQAVRGQLYTCPVCHGEVVAKLGEIKQHHFAHLNLLQCTPETVARAVAGLWIAEELRRYLSEQKSLPITWTTQQGDERHQADLLAGVVSVVQNRQLEWGVGDIVLLDSEGQPKTIILLGLDPKGPDQAQVEAWKKSGVTALLLNPSGVRSGQLDLEQLLAQSMLLGGWWRLEQPDFPPDILTDPDKIRTILKELVQKPPYAFSRDLVQVGALQHVLEINEHKIWLSREIWEQAIGGTLNRLPPDLEVIIKEWKQSDGSTVALFYISLHNHSSAIAVRRYPAHEPVRIKMDSNSFQLQRTTALQVAQQLAGHAMELPR
jgi:hypothetical protein